MATKQDKFFEHIRNCMSREFWRTAPTRLIRAYGDGTPKEGELAHFTEGERVVVKEHTYKVVYVNRDSVTLEPVSPILDVKTDEG